MAGRDIIKINEDLCDGCGKCIPACTEGALKIVDGKAKLVSETYCDGLGSCLGECPNGALEIETREADPFNNALVEEHILKVSGETQKNKEVVDCRSTENVFEGRTALKVKEAEPDTQEEEGGSRLANWPIQIHLVPPESQYLENGDILVAADCVPFAFPDFHEKLLKNKVLLVGCPKLDDHSYYLEKLSQMFMKNNIKTVTIAYMEVPCCFGMAHLVRESILNSGKRIPMRMIRLSIKGDVLIETEELIGGG
ncbi:MAG: 4Fe-4S binding protein, partial [Actinobacteria bacterium]|nr:4Fe-4S binding protein [Actinomycetota bacterium]